MKTNEIIQLEKFSPEVRKKIMDDKKLLYLFFAAGIFKTTPKSLLNRLSLESWAIAEKAGAVDLLDLQIAEMQEKGGECDKCKKPWRKVEIKAKDIVICSCYEPSCTCYCRCMICHNWLIAELKTGEDHCRNCARSNPYHKTIISCLYYNKTKNKKGEEYITGKCTGEMILFRNNKGITEYVCTENGDHKISYEHGYGMTFLKKVNR